MRLKKIMSLVLACAMALSLVTVASAADTKVYYAEDFSSYNDIADFTRNFSVDSATVSNGYSATVISNAYALHAANGTAILATGSSQDNGGGISADQSAFETNSFDSKTFRTTKPSVAESRLKTNQYYKLGETTLYIMPKDSWDFVENSDETYIISYEMDADIATFINAGEVRWGGGTTWTGAGLTDNKIKYNLWSKADALEGRTPAEGEEANCYNGMIYDGPNETYVYGATTGSDYWNHTDLTLNRGQAYRIAIGHKYSATNTKNGTTGAYYVPVKSYAIDGVAWNNNSNLLNVTTEMPGGATHEGRTAIDGFWHGSNIKLNYGFANIKMYTIKNDSFAAKADVTGEIPVSQKTVRVKFTNPVAPATFSKNVVVKKGDVVMGAEEYVIGDLKHFTGAVDGEAYSYVDVTFAGLEDGTTYTVEFPKTIANEIATPLGEKNVATFTTKFPEIKAYPLTVVGAESLVANGELQSAKMDLYNSTIYKKSVAVIYAVYTTGGQLADIVYANGELAASETTTVEAGVQLNAEGKLKAFIWDGMTALKPYTGSQELDIVAAE